METQRVVPAGTAAPPPQGRAGRERCMQPSSAQPPAGKGRILTGSQRLWPPPTGPPARPGCLLAPGSDKLPAAQHTTSSAPDTPPAPGDPCAWQDLGRRRPKSLLRNVRCHEGRRLCNALANTGAEAWWLPGQASSWCWLKRRRSCKRSRLLRSPGSSAGIACCSNILRQRSGGQAPTDSVSAGEACQVAADSPGAPGCPWPSPRRSLHAPALALASAPLASPGRPAGDVAPGAR